MSKVKLQVAKAVQSFKRGVDKRNVNNTESEIATFIDEQIELKEAEVKVFKKDIAKYGEQNTRDFTEGLAIFEEDSIKTVKGRESYAEYYVSQGISKMNRNKQFIDSKNAAIKVCNADISDLKEFRGTLETIVVDVEESDE
jgi:hypothetical protein